LFNYYFLLEFEERVGLSTPRKKKKSMMKGIEDLAAVKQEIFSGSEGEVTPKKKNSRKDVEMVDISRRIKLEAFSPNRSDSDARVKKKRKKSCVDDD
jgi:hypothetical protein